MLFRSEDKVDDVNVRQKQTATIEWIKKINALESKDRMGLTFMVKRSDLAVKNGSFKRKDRR